MARITRKTQKIFASNAGGSGVAEFGSTADGSTVFTTDPAVIQSAEFEEGLAAGIIAGSKRLPVYEEMNGVYFVLSRQIAYLMQDGIPEWDAGTNYYQYSIVRKTNTYEIYGSVINDNLNNALPSAVTNSNWTYLGNLSSLGGTTRVTQQLLTSGSGTYTTPAGCKQIVVEMVGGGGGGGGSQSASGGTNGGDTTFSTFTAGGGVKGNGANAGAGGTASGGDLNIPGNMGTTGTQGEAANVVGGGTSGGSYFGGAVAGAGDVAGTSAAANTGAGGAGGGYLGADFSGAGGGSGAYVRKLIASPAATYSYAIGAGGTGQTGARAGGTGGSGLIVVTEYY